MKGRTIIGGKFLTVPVVGMLLIWTSACFTIVANDAGQRERDAGPGTWGSGGTTSPSTNAPPSSQDSSRVYELELVAEPEEGADFVLDPTPDDRGAYPAGTAVTISVLLSPGWEISQWVGPVYATSGNIAKVKMDRDQTILLRMAQAGQLPAPPGPP